MLSDVIGIKVLGAAADPVLGQRQMQKHWPDVIVLDLEMDQMDGLTFLQKLMKERPTPVVIFSSLVDGNCETSLKALHCGAVEIVVKPKSDLKNRLPSCLDDLLAALQGASKSKQTRINHDEVIPLKKIAEKLNADVILSPNTGGRKKETYPLIAIGASAGGTIALEQIIPSLPKNVLPILIVQHMPEGVTKAFARRLNELSEVEVKEAENNDPLLPGRVLIAPGGKHMLLRVSSLGAVVRLEDGPPVCRHIPSVDVLFRSVSKFGGKRAMGIILTGMGDDGALGMKEMHDAGVKTIAQDKDSCMVYGMPAEAVCLGGVDKELPLDKISEIIYAHR